LRSAAKADNSQAQAGLHLSYLMRWSAHCWINHPAYYYRAPDKPVEAWGKVLIGVGPDDEARCRSVVESSIYRNAGDSLMLSGGLDTSIIAHVVAERARPKCYTVVFPLGESPDVPYAKAIARRLALEWEVLALTPERLPERLADVIRVLKTFDPMEVRNSVAVYHGLAAARDQGFCKVMTGDAVDELFAGYSFSFNLPPLELMKRLRDLWRVMHFSSKPMADSLGISASLPYLDPLVVRFAKTLSPEQLVGSRNGKKYGKLILRVAFEKMIGKKSAWRVKMPIEYGSGTTFLPKYYENKITHSTFNRGQKVADSQDKVKIRDKEHLEYYRLYRTIFPPPSELARTDHRCPECGADVRPGSTFCITCGAYPIVAAAAP
jgi:asparagine synthase (glutamine-hydrolysing)